MCSWFKIKHILFVLLLFHAFKDGSGMFEWLFGKDSTESSESDDSKEPITRFEVLSTDEKFLDFATTLADLSPLDACYHIVSSPFCFFALVWRSLLIIIMKNFNRRNSHGSNSKRRELAQHALTWIAHIHSHITSFDLHQRRTLHTITF